MDPNLDLAKKILASRAGKWLSFSLLVALAVSRLGIPFLPDLPNSVAITIVSILIGTCLYLLFAIYERTTDYGRERVFVNHDHAQKHINQKLEELSTKRAGSSVPIEIKIVGVALSYSYPWISEKLSKLVASRTGFNVTVDVCMVSPEYLKTKGFDPELPIDWVERCSGNLSKLKRLQQSGKLSISGRLKVNLYVYQNLPHWHGILIDNNYLYLSRTNWEPGSFETETSVPRFTVGQNLYRLYYRNDNFGGDERIELFQNWFNYYRKTAVDSSRTNEVSQDRARPVSGSDDQSTK